MLLTVAEFSKRTGVSKKRLYSDLNGRLKPYMVLENGIKKIQEEAIVIYGITQATTNIPQEQHTEEKKQPQAIVNNNEAIASATKIAELEATLKGKEALIGMLEATIEEQKAEVKRTQEKIDEKDKEIRENTERFQELLRNSQILIAQQQEQIKRIEAAKEEVKPEAEADTDEEAEEDITEEEEERKRKSWRMIKQPPAIETLIVRYAIT